MADHDIENIADRAAGATTTRHRPVVERRNGWWWWECQHCIGHTGYGREWAGVLAAAERHALGLRRR